MTKTSYPIAGACQCGGVTFTLLAPPKAVIACHCKECQKLATSAFSITAMVDAKDIEFNGEMREWERMADSGNRNVAKYCPTCGNRIYHINPEEPDTIKLKAATSLENTDILNPTAHLWLSQKQAWFEVPDGVIQKQTQS